MNLLFGSFGVIFAIVSLVPFIAILIFIVVVARRASRFQSKVFSNIEPSLFEQIDRAEKPNRHYIKTKCDNCGANCTNASDISPSGDLKCAYCDSWFNVLRT